MKTFKKLLVAAVALLSLVMAPAAQAVVGDCTPGSDWGSPRQDLAPRVVELVNEHRASKGLVQVQSTSTLTNAGLWKSRHMAKYGYLGHSDPAPPVARSAAERLLACGYPSDRYGWGENIARGYSTPEAVMQAWLASTGHRANIENPSFRAIGVGVAANGSGTLHWTQIFGTLVQTSSGPTTAVSVPSSISVSRGTVRSGGYGDLKADDNSFFQVNSSNRATAWYGRMTGVTNALSSLKVNYRGLNSAACNQDVGIWNWNSGAWVWLDSRSVGSTETEIAVSPGGTLANYVSGSSGNGDVAVMVRCSGTASFFASGDLMKITYTIP